MTPPTAPTPPARGTSDSRARVLHWIVLVIALVDLGILLTQSNRDPSRNRPYAWVIPLGLLCFGLGGLLAPRHPTVRRVLIAASMVAALAGIVLALRS